MPLIAAKQSRRNPRHGTTRIGSTDFQAVHGASQFRSSRLLCFSLFSILFIIGCNSLAPGDTAAIRSLHVAPTTTSATSTIILIRGWRDLWSTGIDELAEKIKTDARPAAVFKEGQWREVADALTASAKSKPLPRPVMLIGFSYGADDVIQIARRLHELHQPVDRLILIDPVTPAEIPPNVKRCVNYYQSNGAWDIFPWLRGVPVKAQAATKNEAAQQAEVVNLDLRSQKELLEEGTSHKTIAANTKVHAAILKELREATVGLDRSLPSH